MHTDNIIINDKALVNDTTLFEFALPPSGNSNETGSIGAGQVFTTAINRIAQKDKINKMFRNPKFLMSLKP